MKMFNSFDRKRRVFHHNFNKGALSAQGLARLREDEIIARKKSQIENLESKSFYFASSDEKRKKKEVAFTLPLECWGFK